MASDRHRCYALLGVLLVLLSSVPVAAAAAAAPAGQQPSVGLQENATATPTPTPTGNETANTSNTTNQTMPSGPGLSMANQTRITPLRFDKDYLRIETVKPDKQFNITGPYAAFSTTKPVEAARIPQPGATARVLDGSQTVQVSFEPDAATEHQASYYQMELFFADGSRKMVDVYVKKTDLTVVSATLKKADEFIEDMKDDAEAHGFEPTIDGITEYHEWEKQQADIFSNLLGPELSKLLGVVVAFASSALAVILGLLAIRLVAKYLLRQFEDKLKSHQNGDNLAHRKWREMVVSHREDSNSAAESRLEEVPEIGRDHKIWSSAFGLETELQLGKEFALGRQKTNDNGVIVRQQGEDAEPVRDEKGDVVTDRNGDPIYQPVTVHDGLDDLEHALQNGESLHETWLEPVLRPDMLESEEAALSQAAAVTKRLANRWGQPQYAKTHRRLTSMLEDIASGRRNTYADPSDYIGDSPGSSAALGGGSNQPAGGDD